MTNTTYKTYSTVWNVRHFIKERFTTVGTYKKDMAHLNKSIISKCLCIYYVLICVHGGGIYIHEDLTFVHTSRCLLKLHMP